MEQTLADLIAQQNNFLQQQISLQQENNEFLKQMIKTNRVTTPNGGGTL